MSDPADALTLQFLAWIAERPRAYGDVMDAWRTSCPRLSIWEDALREGLVEVNRASAGRMRERLVAITPRGRAALAAAAPSPARVPRQTPVPVG